MKIAKLKAYVVHLWQTHKRLPSAFHNPPQAKPHNKEKKNPIAKLYRKQYIIQQIS